MDVRDDAAAGDGGLDKRVQLLVTADGQLWVGRGVVRGGARAGQETVGRAAYTASAWMDTITYSGRQGISCVLSTCCVPASGGA